MRNLFQTLLITLSLLLPGAVYAQAPPPTEPAAPASDIVYYFLIDVSPSMSKPLDSRHTTTSGKSVPSRLDEVRQQVLDFVQSIATRYGKIRVRVFVFSEKTQEICSVTLGEDPNDMVYLMKTTRKIAPVKKGGSRIFSSLKKIYTLANEEIERDPTIRIARIVCLSDGEDTEKNPPVEFFREKGVSSDNWSRLEPVFVSIRQKTSEATSVETIFNKNRIPVYVGSKPESLLPPEPLLKIYPAKLQDGEYVLEAGQSALFASLSEGRVKKTVIELDGNPYDSKEVESIFDVPGEHIVRLTVFGENDVTGQFRDYKLRVVPKAPLKANFTVSAQKISVGQTVTLWNTSEGSYSSALWRVGNRQFSDPSSLHGISVSFDKPGNYHASLKICDDSDGRVSQYAPTDAIVVQAPSPPKAMLIMYPETPRVDEQITFQDVSNGGEVASREWLIDGYPVGSEGKIEHVFNERGSHEVVLTVKDEFGGESVSKKSIEVQPLEAPAAEIALSTSDLQAQRAFNVYAKSVGGIVDSYRWELDGDEIPAADEPDAAEIIVATPGSHSIRLTASGPGGETVVEKSINVAAIDRPIPEFFAPEDVQVDDETKILDYSQGSDVISYLIDDVPLEDYPRINAENLEQEDGESDDIPSVLVVDESDSANPVVLFKDPGIYQVVQVCRNAGGESRSAIKEVTVNPIEPPTAKILPPTAIVAGVPARFSVVTTGDLQRCAALIGETVVELDMSSKSADGLLNFEYTFDNSDVFEMSLEASGRGGSIKTEPISLEVAPQNLPPEANLAIECDRKYGEVAVKIFNRSRGDDVSILILKDGSKYEEIENVEHSGLIERTLSPGAYRFIVTAQNSGYPDVVQERVLKIHEHSAGYIPLLGLSWLVATGLIGAGVWCGIRLYRQAIRGCFIEFRLEKSASAPWTTKYINKIFSREVTIAVDGKKRKLRISKRYVPGDVMYALRLNSGESKTFSKYSCPTRTKPLKLGGLELAFVG